MKNKFLFCVLSISVLLLTGCGSTFLSDYVPEDTKGIESDDEKLEDDISDDIVSAELSEENYTSTVSDDYIEYEFRNDKLLDQHYEKHGIEMGFGSAEEYESAAADVINNPDALHKKESEDDDVVYYLEVTNEFVVLSDDGYIRTYFNPDSGKKYYDRQ